MAHARQRTIKSALWAAVPALSLGLLAWVPMLHAWFRLRVRRCLVWALVLAAFLVPALVVTGMASSLGIIAAVGFGLIQSISLRTIMFSDATTRATDLDPIAAGRRNRALRAEARRIIAVDPALARDLQIGRPDIPGRRYDDGGLVDINSVPVDTLRSSLDLDPEHATEITRIRRQAGSLMSVDELARHLTVPAEVIHGIRHRAVAISD